MVNKPLIRPYFLGVTLGGGWLTSPDIRNTLDSAKKNTPAGNIYKTTTPPNSLQIDGQFSQIQLAR